MKLNSKELKSAVAKRTHFFTTLKPWPISIICRFNEFAIFPPRAKKIAVAYYTCPIKITSQDRKGMATNDNFALHSDKSLILAYSKSFRAGIVCIHIDHLVHKDD